MIIAQKIKWFVCLFFFLFSKDQTDTKNKSTWTKRLFFQHLNITIKTKEIDIYLIKINWEIKIFWGIIVNYIKPAHNKFGLNIRIFVNQILKTKTTTLFFKTERKRRTLSKKILKTKIWFEHLVSQLKTLWIRHYRLKNVVGQIFGFVGDSYIFIY